MVAQIALRDCVKGGRGKAHRGKLAKRSQLTETRTARGDAPVSQYGRVLHYAPFLIYLPRHCPRERRVFDNPMVRPTRACGCATSWPSLGAPFRGTDSTQAADP